VMVIVYVGYLAAAWAKDMPANREKRIAISRRALAKRRGGEAADR
jgi:hypothetical protein